MKITLFERFQPYWSAFIFWLIFATPIAIISFLVSGWPDGVPFPLRPAAISSACTLVGVALFFLFKPERAIGLTERKWRLVLTSGLIGVVLSFLTGAMTEHYSTGGVKFVLGLSSGFGTLLGITTFLSATLFYSWMGRHMAVIWDRRLRKVIYFGVFLSFVVCVLAVAFFVIFNKNIVSAALENPGGFFAFVVGVATLAGVYFTVHSLAELGKTITTFPELARRLVRLLEDTDQRDFVRSMCYTPLTGSLAIPTYQFARLRSLIRDGNISAVTLQEDDLREWLESFKGRTTVQGFVDEEKIADAINQAEHTLASFKERSNESRNSELMPVRLRFDQMPGFYWFSNSERAIVVAPVFLPLPLGASRDSQIRNLDSVQMVGIETVDPIVVSWVNRLHQVYRQEVGEVKDFCAKGTGGVEGLLKELERVRMDMGAVFNCAANEIFFRLHLYKSKTAETKAQSTRDELVGSIDGARERAAAQR